MQVQLKIEFRSLHARSQSNAFIGGAHFSTMFTYIHRTKAYHFSNNIKCCSPAANISVRRPRVQIFDHEIYICGAKCVAAQFIAIQRTARTYPANKYNCALGRVKLRFPWAKMMRRRTPDAHGALKIASVRTERAQAAMDFTYVCAASRKPTQIYYVLDSVRGRIYPRVGQTRTKNRENGRKPTVIVRWRRLWGTNPSENTSYRPKCLAYVYLFMCVCVRYVRLQVHQVVAMQVQYIAGCAISSAFNTI